MTASARANLDGAIPPCGALLFDLDGTLVDSRRDIVDALTAALLEEGYAALPFEAVLAMVGDGARLLVERALAAQPMVPGEAQADELERTLAVFQRRYAERPCAHTRLLPGALEALAIVPNGLVTNKPRALTLLVLEALAIRDRFGAVFAGGDGPLKPAPDGVLRTAAELGVPPEEAWFVGDSPQDVVAGRNAGCFTVVVPGIAAIELVRAAKPDLIVESLFDVARLAAGALDADPRAPRARITSA